MKIIAIAALAATTVFSAQDELVSRLSQAPAAKGAFGSFPDRLTQKVRVAYYPDPAVDYRGVQYAAYMVIDDGAYILLGSGAVPLPHSPLQFPLKEEAPFPVSLDVYDGKAPAGKKLTFVIGLFDKDGTVTRLWTEVYMHRTLWSKGPAATYRINRGIIEIVDLKSRPTIFAPAIGVLPSASEGVPFITGDGASINLGVTPDVLVLCVEGECVTEFFPQSHAIIQH